ncbi:YchJ family metal-binding protein [Microbulbifer sp. GL-2]|uniref:YchJ family metal-binding protein n=1 Tax=Microbulbifer sp. GL-2 TaxID=2591606 RepID=UPI00117C0E29|nr:YchJ family metal-binding protein [Microbulbifer sp. GL-2]
MGINFCPCGSGQLFVDCCKDYVIGGAYPLDAETLIRSRHTAELLGCSTYIQDTWCPETYPGKDKVNMNCTQWTDMKIIDVFGGDDDIIVHVQKKYIENNCEHYVDKNLLIIRVGGKLMFYYSLE